MADHEDTSIRKSLTSVLPAAEIRKLAEQTGAVLRRRKDVWSFVRRRPAGYGG
jgi:hypothetical protein